MTLQQIYRGLAERRSYPLHRLTPVCTGIISFEQTAALRTVPLPSLNLEGICWGSAEKSRHAHAHENAGSWAQLGSYGHGAPLHHDFVFASLQKIEGIALGDLVSLSTVRQDM